MTTTIQVEEDIRNTLNAMKMHLRETYNDVIERLLEDLQELNEETNREIAIAVKEIESGTYKSHEEVKQEMGF